tara:strand:- start:1475 stop:1735 length:261 start_codon:yes stop_codon:yes gene_type:complete
MQKSIYQEFHPEEKGWHKQYIKITLMKYNSPECHGFNTNDLKKVSRSVTTAPYIIVKEIYLTITGDWNKQNSPVGFFSFTMLQNSM